MKLVKVSKIFYVKYGVNLELVDLEEASPLDPNSISFVSRIEKNNGISTYVKKIEGFVPNSANTISVAGGGSVLSTFFQDKEYYSGRDVYILIPKKKTSQIKLLFYAFCIRRNKYRYNYGRQANKTLKDLLIPESMPKKFQILANREKNSLNSKSINKSKPFLNISKWKYFSLKDDLFHMTLGKPVHSEELMYFDRGTTNYVTRTKDNNGVELSLDITNSSDLKSNEPDCLIIGAEGFSAFYQSHPFITGNKINILRNSRLNKYNALFIKTVLDRELHLKFNYGRGATKERLSFLKIKLPSKKGKPDWRFMEDYIKSQPYSSSL